MEQNTLRVRLLVFSVISSVFLISIFTYFQLNNQLQATQKFKVYQAQQAAVNIRQRLHDILSNMPPDAPRSRAIKVIKQTVAGAIGSGVVDTVVVLGKDGSPVVSQGKLNLVFDGKKYFLSEIWDMKNESKWLVPLIDEERGLAGLFFEFDNPYGFTLKLFFSLSSPWEAASQIYMSIILAASAIIITHIVMAAFLLHLPRRSVEVPARFTRIGNISIDNLERIVDIKTQSELKTFTDRLDQIASGSADVAVHKELERDQGEDNRFLVLYTGPDNFRAFIAVNKVSEQNAAKKDTEA